MTIADDRDYEDLVEGLDAIVWEADADTFQFTYVSRRAEVMLGYPVEDWLGDPSFWVELIHPDDREETVGFCRGAVREKRDHTFEYRVIAADGRVVWLRDIVRFEASDDGDEHLRGLMVDITDRKQAEEELKRTRAALKESRDYLQGILDHATSVIHAKDLDGRYLFVNRSFEKLVGIPARGLIGKSVHDFLDPDKAEEFHANDRKVIETGEPLEFEETLSLDDGVHVFRSVRFPLRDESGSLSGVCTFSTDITRGRELEEQLRQAQKMEAIGRLAGGIAHDFNNLLGVILNYAQFVRDESSVPAAVRDDAEEIRRAAERAASLTHQLLVFSRREVSSPDVLDVNDVVSDIEKLLRRSIGERVALHLDLDPNLWPVHMDRGQLGQVLINLAVNARDAMPEGGILAVRTTNVSTSRDEVALPGLTQSDYVRLEVRDVGTGMPPEVIKHAFEPFFTTKPKGAGTGLGLATVYGIVDNAAGHIALRSEVGRGSSVVIHLPAASADQTDRVEREPSSLPLAVSETVMVVEDEPSLRRLIVRMLERAGYNVVAAGDGDEALRFFARGTTVDLLVTDVVLPGMSGPEVAKAVRSASSGARVLYMSGYPQEVVSRQGALDAPLLAKPFTAEGLLQRVQEILSADAKH